MFKSYRSKKLKVLKERYSVMKNKYQTVLSQKVKIEEKYNILAGLKGSNEPIYTVSYSVNLLDACYMSLAEQGKVLNIQFFYKNAVKQGCWLHGIDEKIIRDAYEKASKKMGLPVTMIFNGKHFNFINLN